MTLAPQTVALIEQLLTRYAVADVPGYVRQQSQIIVSYADVLDVYERIAVAKLGRKALHYTRPPVAMPDDFARWAAIELNDALITRYAVSQSLITRWRREANVPAPARSAGRRGGVPCNPPPAGFAEAARGMTVNQVRKHWSIAETTARRWMKEAGVKMRPAGRPSARPQGQATPASMHVMRDLSHAGRAADFLRHYGPVHRCDERGRSDPAGSHWRRGNAVLMTDELIERAELRGFDANAWRRAA